MIRRPGMLAASLVAVAALTTAACGGSAAGSGSTSSASQTDGQSITIGVSAELTGPGAGTYGLPQQAGFKVAEQELASSGYLGKTTLNLVEKDDQTDPTQAVTIFNQFVQQGAPLVIESSYTSILEALQPFANRSKTALIVIGSAGTGNDVDDYVFRMTDFRTPVNTLAKYVVAQGESGRVVVVVDKTNPALVAIGGVFQQDLESAGGSAYAGEVSVTATDTDFSTAVTTVKSLKPSAVVVLTAPAQAGNIISQLRSGGVSAPVIGHPGWSVQVAQIAGAAANGAVFPQAWSPTQANSKQFVAQYEEANKGAVPTAEAALAHDTLWLIAVAVKSITGKGQKVTGETLKDALPAAAASPDYAQHELINGFSLNAAGAPNYPGILVKFENGALTGA